MESGAVRASDAERDATVERLRDAAAEGRLTLEELADRIEVAGNAVTRGELDARCCRTCRRRCRSHTWTPPASARSATSSAPAPWVVPAERRFRSWLGHIKLDLREARISEPEVRIHAWALFGTIDLLVPEGVEVDVQARAAGGPAQAGEPERSPSPGAPRVVLTGGDVVRRDQGPPPAAVGEARGARRQEPRPSPAA